MEAISRFDPFPRLVGPQAPRPATDAVLRLPGVRSAAPSVVRVVGTACGLGITGSGWVAGRELVVTAAHVVAGQARTYVQVPGRRGEQRAYTVAFDARNDVAVLRVSGLGVPALRFAEPQTGQPVAILGYPESGPFRATAARVGRTARVLSEDVYGNRPRVRTMTSLSGQVRHCNSGGPAVDENGVVRATIFGAARSGATALGVPADVVRGALERAGDSVSTGRCLR
jgi:hypothetical protein